jgi:DNA-directed RNA polymerase specialized sigma24 family protein
MGLEEFVEDPTDEESNDAGERLVEALQLLTPEERDLVELSSELRTEEIATRLGIGKRSVQLRLQLIRARVQKYFQERA